MNSANFDHLKDIDPPLAILAAHAERYFVDDANTALINPQAYLADILDRIHDHKINRLDELLPWNWAPMVVQSSQAA